MREKPLARAIFSEEGFKSGRYADVSLLYRWSLGLVNRIVPSKLLSGCCGLAAMAIAIFAGLIVNQPTDVIFERALLCAVLCSILGGVVGFAIEVVAQEAIERHKRLNPLASSVGRTETPSAVLDEAEEKQI